MPLSKVLKTKQPNNKGRWNEIFFTLISVRVSLLFASFTATTQLVQVKKATPKTIPPILYKQNDMSMPFPNPTSLLFSTAEASSEFSPKKVSPDRCSVPQNDPNDTDDLSGDLSSCATTMRTATSATTISTATPGGRSSTTLSSRHPSVQRATDEPHSPEASIGHHKDTLTVPSLDFPSSSSPFSAVGDPFRYAHQPMLAPTESFSVVDHRAKVFCTASLHVGISTEVLPFSPDIYCLSELLQTTKHSRQETTTASIVAAAVPFVMTKEAWQSPGQLAIGDAYSVVVPSVAYDPRHADCHTIAVQAEDVQSVWLDTLRFFGEQLFHSSSLSRGDCYSARSVSASLLLTGCFCERMSSSTFLLGVMMRSPGAKAKQLCVEIAGLWAFRHQRQLSLHQPLPVAAVLQEGKVTLWWQPSALRVTPNVPIPPLRAMIDIGSVNSLRHKHGQGDRYTSHLCPPEITVRLFLFRGPQHATLSGTLVYPNVKMTENRDSLSFATNRRCTAVRNDLFQTAVTFSDISVSHTGEIVLGIEVLLPKPLQAFCTPLSALLSPFRCVESQDS
jgi:hypothetical protein